MNILEIEIKTLENTDKLNTKLTKEDMNQVSERISQAYLHAASSMNLTVLEFNKLIVDGELSKLEFFKHFLKYCQQKQIEDKGTSQP